MNQFNDKEELEALATAIRKFIFRIKAHLTQTFYLYAYLLAKFSFVGNYVSSFPLLVNPF
jgi:hypothetical protein